VLIRYRLVGVGQFCGVYSQVLPFIMPRKVNSFDTKKHVFATLWVRFWLNTNYFFINIVIRWRAIHIWSLFDGNLIIRRDTVSRKVTFSTTSKIPYSNRKKSKSENIPTNSMHLNLCFWSLFYHLNSLKILIKNGLI